MEQNTRAAFIRQMLKDESMIEPSPEFSYKALVKSRQDYDELYRDGAAAIFGPGTPIATAAIKILEILLAE